MVHLIQNVLTEHAQFAYLILFLIVFAETGLVVFPFLPGDSLLFIAGFMAGTGSFNLGALYILLIAAALCGDNCNYWIGRLLGPRLFSRENSRFFQRKNLDKTHAFYEKYGAKAVIMARFVPVVRTFAPFVAGIGAMQYARFLTNSIIGAILWVGICVTAGWKFGGNPFVQKHFELVVVAIVFISVLPMVFEYVAHRRKAALETASVVEGK